MFVSVNCTRLTIYILFIENRNSSSREFYSTPSMQSSDSYRMSPPPSSSSLIPRQEIDYQTREYEMTISADRHQPMSHKTTDHYDDDDDAYYYCSSYQNRSSLKHFRSNMHVNESRRPLRR